MTAVARLARASMGRRLEGRVFFLHLPKCGGEAIHEAIRNSFGPVAAIGGRGMVRINPAASARAAALFDDPVDDYRRRLMVYNMENPATRYLAGHLALNEPVMRSFGSGWEAVTVFREPVSRFFSAYFYNRYKGSEHARIDTELAAFVESERAARLGSDYVWRLASEHDDDPGSEAAVAEAVRRLERFAVVGALERLDAFVDAFEARLGPRLRLGRRNQGPVSEDRRNAQITADIRRQVETLCEPNRRVYEAVLESLAAVGPAMPAR